MVCENNSLGSNNREGVEEEGVGLKNGNESGFKRILNIYIQGCVKKNIWRTIENGHPMYTRVVRILTESCVDTFLAYETRCTRD